MLSELIHGGVGDAHIPEHTLQFRRELTAAFGLIGEDQEKGHISFIKSYSNQHSYNAVVNEYLSLCNSSKWIKSAYCRLPLS